MKQDNNSKILRVVKEEKEKKENSSKNYPAYENNSCAKMFDYLSF